MGKAYNKSPINLSLSSINGYSFSEKSLKIQGEKCEKYKNTIQRIVKILQNFLKNSELDITHISIPSSLDSIWKTIHYVYNKHENPINYPIFNTFGKGTTLEKAQASGFGEMIERIQIGYMFSRNIFKPRLFPFTINKISNDKIRLNDLFIDSLNALNPFLPKKWNHNKLYVPYNLLNDHKKIPIESRFLIDSTGAAAGNSYSEAFVQALCEIFERYCAGYILLNRKKCPTITKSYLCKKSQQIIKELEDNNIEVIIKDLSLGSKELPVIGTILKYPVNDKEDLPKLEFKVASSPSLNIAFERTITETIQKATDYKSRLILAQRTLKSAKKLYRDFPDLESYLPFRLLMLIRFSHRSIYIDKELDFLKEDKGYFSPWSYCNKDSSKELKVLTKICVNNGWSLYYKFYDWLNFPTLKLYSPSLNFGFRTFTEYTNDEIKSLKLRFLEKDFTFTSNDIKKLSSQIFLIHCWMHENLASFLDINTKTLNKTCIWDLLGLISLLNDKIELAIKFFKQNEKFAFKKIELYKDKGKIKKYLETLIPDCRGSCLTCSYKNECNYFYLKEQEQEVFVNYPKIFKRKIFDGTELKYFA